MIRLAIFDMDGTLTEEPSSWEYVHRRLRTDNHRNFRLYKNGFITYEEFFRSDVMAWLRMHPRLTKNDIKEILREIRIREGVMEVIETLRNSGVITAVVSGGISWLFYILSESMKLDYNISNIIGTDEHGFVEPYGRIQVIPEHKDIAVQNLQMKLQISRNETVSIGDQMENGKIHENSSKAFVIGNRGINGEIPLGYDMRKLIQMLKDDIKA